MATDVSDAWWSATEPAATNRTPAALALTLSEIYAVYAPASSLVDRYVTPLWYAVGFPGNLLSRCRAPALTISRPSSCTSTSHSVAVVDHQHVLSRGHQ